MKTRKEIVEEWEQSKLPSTNLILEVCLDIRDLLLKKADLEKKT